LSRLPAIVEAQERALEHVTKTVQEMSESVTFNPFETNRDVYLAIAELRRAHEMVGSVPGGESERGQLTPWELRAFSQNGEDGALAEILRRIGAPERYFVEFGVESGREGNCVLLADVIGWSGLFMEADEKQFCELERKYQPVSRVETVNATVTPANVQQLFERAGVPREPDVLAIDVDGGDYWIWEAITDYRPRVVIIEYNSALDPSTRLVQPREHGTWDGSDFYGASLGAIRSLGDSKGYQLVHTELSGVNAFLVRKDLAEGRFPEPGQVPMRTTNYFQRGYHHPHDRRSQRYLDLDTGELVEPQRRAPRTRQPHGDASTADSAEVSPARH